MHSYAAMNRMRERLERAIKQGLLLSAALGACSSEQTGDPEAGGSAGAQASTAGQAGDDGSVIPGDAGTGNAAHGGDGMGPQLEPYPEQTYPVCSGQIFDGQSSGFSGQCCVTAQCYTPPSGACAAAEAVGYQQLSSFPPGSGRCGCEPASGKAVEGPFAPRAGDEPVTPGRCCYLVAAMAARVVPCLSGVHPA